MSGAELRVVAGRLRELLQELREILINEGERNWLRGVDLCLRHLSDVDSASDAILRERLGDVALTYRTMVGGYGSFSDFHVWREDFDERVRANLPLKRVRSDLWEIIMAIMDSEGGT